MTDVYIGSAKLTPISQLNRTLGSLSAAELCSIVISDLINDIDLSAFDEVIIGQELSGGTGQNLARQTALKAGLLIQVSALMVNQVRVDAMRSPSITSNYLWQY
jgi:acetyl-CoA C-acetyltransferase